MEFWLFLPQMRMTLDAMVARAEAAEAAGFSGLALMDHLAPPHAETQPMYDAIATAVWIGAHTTTLHLGHLVLCDAMHHPAVLAKQAVTIDHATGGRFELGIGWGSVPAELTTYGVGSTDARHRVSRLAESLDVMRRLWTGEPVDFAGEHFVLHGAQQAPVPTRPIPLLIGGTGPRTLDLVRRHADWWNVPLHATDRIPELRGSAGSARPSAQIMIAPVVEAARRDEITATAQRRFGMYGNGLLIGDADEIGERMRGLAGLGVERVYVWFADFAPPETLAWFGHHVIASA